MPKYHARPNEDGTGVTYWDLESIVHAEHHEQAGTLAITLVAGYRLTLQGQEAADVLGFLDGHRFSPPRDPTPEQIAYFKEVSKQLLGDDWAESERPAP